MLVTNQHLNKLAAARRWFTEHGMEVVRVDVEDEEAGAVDDELATYTVKLASRPGASLILIVCLGC